MLKLQWPLCTIWVCVITYTRSQLESNVNYLQILKYPTELAGYEFNKNSLKLCNDNETGEIRVSGADAAPDGNGCGGGKVKTSSTISNPLEDQYSAFLLKIFTNIAQQTRVQQSSCGKSKSSTRMSTAAAGMAGSTIEPVAKSMATSKRSLHVYYEGQHPPEAQGEESFNILEQLKLDEKEQHKLKLQSQQAQHSHNQQLTGLPQDIWEEPIFAQLGKAGKKKKKKKRRKKKKKKPPKDKDKNKKKKKKTKRKKEPNHTSALLAQPAHVLFASLTQNPQFQHHPQHVDLPTPQLPMTTKKPQHHFTPIKKIKYFLRKNTIFKKKKKEYLNHLKQVLYPFVKFIAFFTVLNPFTLAVFLFSLVSPVVFGFFGFVALSFLIKPALGLLFGVKRNISSINRKRLLEKRRRERLRNSRRPITIHKHYYQQKRIPPPPAPHLRQQRPRPHPHSTPLLNYQINHQTRYAPRRPKHFNPLLPHVKHKLKKDTSLFAPNYVRHERITNGN